MKNTKLVIHNRSDLPLKVSAKKSDSSDFNEFEVKRKSRINLRPGSYHIAFYYNEARLELETNKNETLNISHIHSQLHSNHLGKLIEFDNPGDSIIVMCNTIN